MLPCNYETTFKILVINEADGFFKFPVRNGKYCFYRHKNSINIFLSGGGKYKIFVYKLHEGRFFAPRLI